MKAEYLVLEGIDGSGKTSQIELLTSSLRKRGKKVLVTKEFGSPLSEACMQLRQLVLNTKYDFDDFAGQQLLAACSTQHCEKVLRPALTEYDYIISDRSFESNLAYGRALESFYPQITRSMINSLFYLDQRRIYPGRVIFLNVQPETTWARLVKRSPELLKGGVDRIEAKGLPYQKCVQAEYFLRIEENPNYVVIDCDGNTVDETHKKILEGLNL